MITGTRSGCRSAIASRIRFSRSAYSSAGVLPAASMISLCFRSFSPRSCARSPFWVVVIGYLLLLSPACGLCPAVLLRGVEHRLDVGGLRLVDGAAVAQDEAAALAADLDQLLAVLLHLRRRAA